MLWRILARPLLFLLPAETAHHFSMSAFHVLMRGPVSAITRRWLHVRDPALKSNVFGIDFDNPIGLAAGFDKQAAWFNSLGCLGFSHVEVGTITGLEQPGNPQPRLFRLPADQALINRMGFNNAGAEKVASQLRNQHVDPVLGINIGKSKVVPIDQSDDDYLKSFRLLYPYADYFTVNVSSPNTPGLRQLQDREPLLKLLSKLIDANRQLAAKHQVNCKPVLLKIAPDLHQDQLADIATIARDTQIDGIIATNTSVGREGLRTDSQTVAQIGNGGLSGRPLTMHSRKIVRWLYNLTDGQIPIVGAGGIMNGEDAWQMICAGARLVQIYTGFIYGGPRIVKLINQHLLAKLKEHKLDSIQRAVGMFADREI